MLKVSLKRIRLVSLIFLAAVFFSFNSSAQRIMVSFDGNELYNVNPETGATTLHKTIQGLTNVIDVTYIPETRTMIGIDRIAADDFQLFYLPLCDDVVEKTIPISGEINGEVVTSFEGLAYHPEEGLVYLGAHTASSPNTYSSSFFGTIDAETGVFSYLGFEVNTFQNDVDNIEYYDGEIYVLDADNTSGRIYRIDLDAPTDAEKTVLVKQYNTSINDFFFDANGMAYGFNKADQELYRFDLFQPQAEDIDPTNASFNALEEVVDVDRQVRTGFFGFEGELLEHQIVAIQKIDKAFSKL